MSDKDRTPSCVDCNAVWKNKGTTNCWSNDPATAPTQPGSCPSKENKELIDDSFAICGGDSDDAKLAITAAKVEGMCYQPVPGSDAVNARWNRVEDTVALAKLMEFKRIGIATCIGLLYETSQLTKILEGQGFDVVSVCCKAGSKDKMELDLEETDKVRPNTFEPACNPIAQARLLNQSSTDMNIIVGLCVGHDMLFSKYSEAPVTTMVVKDRVTGHNPVSVLYGQNFYYKRLQSQPVDVGGK